ncbi:MAG: NADPH:quinone oxidoreductase family protein [Phenylobacterium sp.]|uniref:NADPH:quinone oxidoreductase family protein n=1 Tax=Phenylobacterium sp. TaxID=1871053 RepID=UPI001B7534CC|nr:NADPH:quinone oxidoreductase family protein [Phenylobacterium sp.]MBP7815792.1 NADPH:quinone oxidoreductase family protein [Phenylobacterium sp.]MBP9231309.1 NADPH:quinone oxidoreductase family protein [Phenylobacterium sp.]MBP9754635.1 NADPH:quinone oxidoreductase family protein [Phenylobacterium sp.]
MKALVVEELAADYGGCVLKEIETPEPRAGEVRIKVRAAAVNFPDLLQTRGEYQHKPALPFIPGMEIAGEVEALGEGVTQFQIGDAVVGGARIGGFSEYAVTPAAILRPKPANLSFSQAAGYATAYLTAYVSLVRRAQVEPGEWVLVHGAAGGVGLAAVDLAKHLGCKVIAASASDEKLNVIEKEYAPDATVNVTGGFRERVKEITGGRGADVIYDPVGGDVFDESVRCIAFNGRILSIGFTSGRLPVLPVNMALIKGFSVMGVRAGEYGRQFPEKGRENAAAIWALANEGKVHPRVDHEYPLSEWRAAFESLANRKVVGKTIVRPDL